MDLKQAMIWMGHADEKMILRVYDHAGDARARAGLSQMEKMLDGMQNGMQENTNSPQSVNP